MEQRTIPSVRLRTLAGNEGAIMTREATPRMTTLLRLIHGTHYEDASDGQVKRARAARKDDTMLRVRLRARPYEGPTTPTGEQISLSSTI